MKKRIFCLLLVCLMLLPFVPMRAHAVVGEIAREGYWVLGVEDYDPNTYLIIDYLGTASNVTVPTKVKGYTVEGIHNFTFMDNTTMKTLNVPDGIKILGLGGCNVETINLGDNVTLGSDAFRGLEYLKKVNLPINMKKLPWSLFENCTSLETVTLPENLEIIGEDAFLGCTSLSSIDLPDTVVEIEKEAFRGCTKLTSIELPDSLTTVAGWAFAESGLRSITIPKSVTDISGDTFDDCTALEEIIVEAGNPEYYTVDGNLCYYNDGHDKVYLMRGRSVGYSDSYTIPEGIDAIDSYAFTGAVGLKKLVIPETVDDIGTRVFIGCTNLSEIWLRDYVYCSPYVFYELTCTVYYPGDREGFTDSFFDKDFQGNITWVEYCSGLHKAEIGTVIQEPSCTQTGVAENVCEVCGETYLYDIPMVEHSYDEGVVTVESTCTTYGEMLHTCTVCGEVKTERINMKDHDWDEGEYTKEPTCTSNGELVQYCRNCDWSRITYPSRLGHDYSNVAQMYDETGRHHIISCTRCHVAQDPEPCTFEVKVLVEATLDFPGLREYSCAVCGGSYLDEFLYRIYGSGRCETAIAAAEELKAALGVESFDTIILASGNDFADALSGSYLAAAKGAPILLYRANSMELNLNYIAKNLTEGGTVYILGGSAAVPAEVEEVLAGYHVVRLAGNTRFDTNLAILEEAGVGDREILICTGQNFADSLSASATGLPILMVNNITGALTDNQIAFLEKLNGNALTIIGGTGAVSAELETALGAYGDVGRIFGNSREYTSVLVAQTYFDNPDCVLLAYSRNFPDGLCGGPLAYALGAPLILTNSGMETAATEYVAENGVRKGAALGGTAALTDATATVIFGLNG